jgi:hypothetical protein
MVSLRAVRVALALHELKIRRDAHAWTEKKQGRTSDFTPRYSAKELGKLLGLPEKKAKAALRELLALGLLAEFSETKIAFARALEDLSLTDQQREDFLAWFAALTRRKRVPIPRRILALLAESTSPAFIASILGYSLRCIWLHPEEGFRYRGRVSCAWIADRFSVCLRAVKSARSLLVDLGWLKPQGRPNRFGELFAINPHWERLTALKSSRAEATIPQGEEHLPDARAGQGTTPDSGSGVSPGPKSAPLPTPPGSKSAPPVLRESLPSEELKHQDQRESPAREPERRSGPGVYSSEISKNQDQKPGDFPPPPRLSNIRPELDFADIERLLELHRQGVKCGLVSGSEFERLMWVAAAERARTLPDVRNPAGVFLRLVKAKLWRQGYLSEGQIEAANRRLKEYLFGGPRKIPLLVPRKPVPGSGASCRGPRLSRDARVLQAIRNHGVRDLESAFPVLRGQYGWDRPRFVAAQAELEGRLQPLAAATGSGVLGS